MLLANQNASNAGGGFNSNNNPGSSSKPTGGESSNTGGGFHANTGDDFVPPVNPNSGSGPSGHAGRGSGDNNDNNEEFFLPPHGENLSAESDAIKDIRAQLASLTQREGLKKVGVTRPYPVEWDLVPYPHKFKPPTLHAYDGKGSPNQHIYYFRSQTGNVIENDAIMARLFIGTLKGVAFDWFRSLPEGSINSWVDLETKFLSRFYEDDTEVSMAKLLATK